MKFYVTNSRIIWQKKEESTRGKSFISRTYILTFTPIKMNWFQPSHQVNSSSKSFMNTNSHVLEKKIMCSQLSISFAGKMYGTMFIRSRFLADTSSWHSQLYKRGNLKSWQVKNFAPYVEIMEEITTYLHFSWWYAKVEHLPQGKFKIHMPIF